MNVLAKRTGAWDKPRSLKFPEGGEGVAADYSDWAKKPVQRLLRSSLTEAARDFEPSAAVAVTL